VVNGFTPPLSCLNGYLEVFLGFFLPDKVGQIAGAQAVFQGLILFTWLAGNNACYFASPPF